MDAALKMLSMGLNQQQVYAVNSTVLPESDVRYNSHCNLPYSSNPNQDILEVLDLVDKIIKLNTPSKRALAKIFAIDLKNRKPYNDNSLVANTEFKNFGVFDEDKLLYGYINLKHARNLSGNDYQGCIDYNSSLTQYIYPLDISRRTQITLEAGHRIPLLREIIKFLPQSKINAKALIVKKINNEAIDLIDKEFSLSNDTWKKTLDLDRLQKALGKSRSYLLNEEQLRILIESFTEESFKDLLETIKTAVKVLSPFRRSINNYGNLVRYGILGQIIAYADESMKGIREFGNFILEQMGIDSILINEDKQEDADIKDSNDIDETVRDMWSSFGASNECVDLAVRVTRALKIIDQRNKHLEILGFDPDSNPSEDDLKSAKKKYSLIAHTDRSRTPQSEWLQKQINQAYDFLK